MASSPVSGLRWWPALVAFAASAAVAVLFAGAFELWQRQSLAQWEYRVQRSLSELRAHVEAELYGNLHLGNRVAALVEGQPELSEAEFTEFAQDLLASGQHAVRYFAYAPEHVVRYIHPGVGSRMNIGRVLSRDSLFAREVEALRRDRVARIAGPYEPVAGTRELIVQIPLFGPNGNREVSGQVDASLDLEQLYRRAEIYRFAEILDLAVRIEGAGVVFGQESVFTHDPIRTDIELPGLRLELAAVPHEGWRAVAPVPAFVVPLSLLMLLGVFAVTWRATAQTGRLRQSEARMRSTGERLTTLLASMPSLVSIIERDGRCSGLYGGRGGQHFDVDEQRVIGRRIDEMLPPAKARKLLAARDRALQDNALQTLEFDVSSEDARAFASARWPEQTQWFRATIAPLPDEHGQPGATLWIYDNITAARTAEQALRRSHERYRQLGAAVQQVVFETDLAGRIGYINQAWEKLSGGLASDTLGQPWISLIHPEDRDALHAAFIDLMSGRIPCVQRDARLAGAGSNALWVSVYLMTLSDDQSGQPRGAIGTLFDINERKISESAIRHQALHDALTGIPNRLLLIERLEQALARLRRQGSQLAVLYVDLDDFKLINDHHGHLAGDQVLHLTAQRLREQVRDTDTVARIGGDEFVVLLDGITTPADVEHIAQKLVSAISQPFELNLPGGKIRCQIGASIGIALAPRDGSTVDALLHHSDNRLYHAKSIRKGKAASASG
ncbi:MAG: diguanylate cyclase [Pseudazoarcus pumilus]|nr:diguanylate cyclase [Pseudazoarcus pumilus]